MDSQVLTAIIAASAALLGSAITGIVTYQVTVKSDKLKQLKRKLIRAYKDISAFYELEQMYTKKIAQHEKTSFEAVRRSYREQLREQGQASPSKYSSPSHISEELMRYEG